MGTKPFQELGTNLKKKDESSRIKVQNSRKINKTQEKRNKNHEKKVTKLTKLQAQGGAVAPLPSPPNRPC